MSENELKIRAVQSVDDLCTQDHKEHVGKILLASLVMGYINDDYAEICCDPPARVRVLDMNYRDMLNWTDEIFCDPNWDIVIVDPHPALENATSTWVDGISRSINGEVQYPSGWKLDENQEPPPPIEKPEDHCIGCGHAKSKGCSCPPLTSEHTIDINCPHCGKTVSITTTIKVER